MLRIQWGRKYGIRIFLDLHALPGSQNAWVSVAALSGDCVPDSPSARTTLVKVSRIISLAVFDSCVDKVLKGGSVNL